MPKSSDNSYAHFVTTKTYHQNPYFSDDILAGIMKEELEFYAGKYSFSLLGYVVMPDHLHLICWRDIDEKPDLTISRIMNSIKAMTSKRVKRYLFYGQNSHYLDSLTDVGQATQRHFRLLQAGFYDFNIYSESKLAEKLNYMHVNPVKAGLATTRNNYHWSSHKSYFTKGTRN
ncbi:MAG: hypothetical protein HOC20_14770 [Chloroflexi bacterium]|jgi:putative transposase|nr:hypothetical protein [Chloroflexota bacterium]